MLLTFRILTFVMLLTASAYAAQAPDIEDQARIIASELRCVVCQNLSVADSPSEMAQQMRAIVREQLEAGKTPDEVKAYFASKYGDWVLLAPPKRGFSLLLWTLPFVVLVTGTLIGLWFTRRWSATKSRHAHNGGSTAPPASSDTKTHVSTAADIMTVEPAEPDPEDSSPQVQLIRDQHRLVSEVTDLEFDFQCGRLSEADYTSLRQDLEAKLASVTERLSSFPPPRARRVREDQPAASAQPAPKETRRLRRWQLVGGGAFLLIFGITLGIFLTNSLRPRSSEQDTLTGGFLTGTNSGSGDVAALLNEGRVAFGKQEWAKAIDTFKKVLAIDPNQPEAHSYMGFILVQAGHADGALMAFERALSVAPNYPMALWGKGMTLYREKQDYAQARQVLTRLVELLPEGQDRNEIEKVLAEVPEAGQPAPTPAKAPATKATQQITGRIDIDPNLKSQVDSGAALFIIARSAGAAGGPPIAVKKIERPAFPVTYSLGPENMMMQGASFSGKVIVSVRLDKDGDPMTREPGNLLGNYKKNPVEVGSKNVDIVIDQVAN